MADNPKKPYGDVKYADPGYQDDGKARYPLDSEEHCRAAWSYINQADNAAKYTPEQLSTVKGRIRSALKKYGVEVSDDAQRTDLAKRPTYERDWALDDIEILSRAKGGDGRTVEAYATPFDVEQEVHDQHGDYREKIARTAFNRTLSHGIDKIHVFYHHGMTLHGTPSDLGSVPIGRPVEVRPDGRGLRTVSRYNKSALADSVLEAIRNGDIRGYSFRGGIYRSDPQRIPRVHRSQPLPLVTRMELGLTEYGPTPTPYYEDAKIMAMRAAQDFAALDADERRELIRILSTATPLVPAEDLATPDLGLGAEDPHDVHSDRLQRLRLRSEAEFATRSGRK